MLSQQFDIRGRLVGPGHSPYVIAEIGSNFDQSRDIAKRLIDSVAAAGADAVKFQLFKADALYPTTHELYPIFKSVELSQDWVPELKRHAEERGLAFFASAFDRGSVDFLASQNVPAFKVASSETTNLPLLAAMASCGKPMIIATGMCEAPDTAEAVELCAALGNPNVALLQCGSVYPLLPSAANLRVMDWLRDSYGCPVGFSDHTLGIYIPIAAVGRSADVIEKHVTLDRRSSGPDHSYALEPAEFSAMVTGIRDAYAALGSRKKELLPPEREFGRREGLYASRDIAIGESFGEGTLAVRRPALGIRARYRSTVEKAKARRPISKDSPVLWTDVEC